MEFATKTYESRSKNKDLYRITQSREHQLPWKWNRKYYAK